MQGYPARRRTRGARFLHVRRQIRDLGLFQYLRPPRFRPLLQRSIRQLRDERSQHVRADRRVDHCGESFIGRGRGCRRRGGDRGLACGGETSFAQNLVIVGGGLIMVGGRRQRVRLRLAGFDRLEQRHVRAQKRQKSAGEHAVGVGVRSEAGPTRFGPPRRNRP